MQFLFHAVGMQKERLAEHLPAPHSQALAQIQDAMIGTKHDIQTELFELRELGLSADDPLVQSRVERIHSWLGEELPRLRDFVSLMASLAQDEPKFNTTHDFLARDCAAIDGSFEAVTNAARAYRAALRPSS